MSKLIFDFAGVSKEDTIILARELNEKIIFITSGERDNMIKRKEYTRAQEDWAQLFTADLRAYGISSKNTSYSVFNYGGYEYEIHVPYVLSETGQNATIGRWYKGKWETFGKTHSAKQAIALLVQKGLYKEVQKIKT